MARELPQAQEADGALHVLFGQVRRHLEIIVLDADGDRASLRALAAGVADSPQTNWLTVLTNDPDGSSEVLKDAGLELLDDTESFMGIELADHPAREPAGPYTLSTELEGAVIRATAHHPSGVEAAHGVMALSGADAVAHNIETDLEHRRRGLAGAVMSALADEALARGATTGLLIASYEGQQLYASLGWRTLATVLVARKS